MGYRTTTASYTNNRKLLIAAAFHAASFAIPLAILGLTLDTDIGFWDTGEMNVVPWILGLAHPTGYPTEILTGWTFAHAWPFGAPAARLTLLNAVEYATSASIAYAFVVDATGRHLLALVGAVGFVTTPLVWTHATHTDVMSLTVTLNALTFLFVWLWRRRGEQKFLIAGAGAAGFATGTHGATLWYLTSIIPLLVGASRPLTSRLAAIAACVMCAVTCALYAYLPLRSTFVVAHGLDPIAALELGPGMPFWNWGDPREPHNFLAVITGSHVSATHAFAELFDPSVLRGALTIAWQTLLAQLSGAEVLVGAIAIAFSCARLPYLALSLMLAVAGVSLFVTAFWQESDPQRYFIFPLWYVWTFVVIGLDTIALWFRTSAALIRYAPLLLIVASVALQFQPIVSRMAQRNDRLATVYASAVLRRTPPNAIVVAPWTYATPLAYVFFAVREGAERKLVSGVINDFERPINKWLKHSAVYAISEKQPQSALLRAIYVCTFKINPDPAHDPKLFRIASTSKSSASAAGSARSSAITRSTARKASAFARASKRRPSAGLRVR